jgi:hypothetical protein
MSYTINGEEKAVDDYGYLLEPDFSEEAVGVIAAACGITLTDQRPRSFWETQQANEYGFWANVNPEVPHPRWSQATERLIGTGERVPTRLFNGYGEFVASLYTGLQNERLWA